MRDRWGFVIQHCMSGDMYFGAIRSLVFGRRTAKMLVETHSAVVREVARFLFGLLFSLMSTLAISGEAIPPASQALDTTNSVPCAAIRLRIATEQSYEIEWRIHFENKEEATFIRKFIGLPGNSKSSHSRISFVWSLVGESHELKHREESRIDGLHGTVWERDGSGEQVVSIGAVYLNPGMMSLNVCCNEIPKELQSFKSKIFIGHYER